MLAVHAVECWYIVGLSAFSPSLVQDILRFASMRVASLPRLRDDVQHAGGCAQVGAHRRSYSARVRRKRGVKFRRTRRVGHGCGSDSVLKALFYFDLILQEWRASACSERCRRVTSVLGCRDRAWPSCSYKVSLSNLEVLPIQSGPAQPFTASSCLAVTDLAFQ